MRLPELLVQVLIFLPALIALSRRSAYRWLIVPVCVGLAAVTLLDVHDRLAAFNARHAVYLFLGEVLAWLGLFVGAIQSRGRDEDEAA